MILPLCLLLAFGYLLRVTRLLDDKTTAKMNSACFKAFFPVMMFNSIYKTDLQTAFQPRLILFGVGTVLTVFVVLLLVAPLLAKDRKKRASMVQGMFRSNFVIFGLPIATALCGDNVAVTSMLIAVVVPIYNILSVAVLEYYKGEGIHVGPLLKGIVTNPLVLGALAGILGLLLHVQLPTALAEVVSEVGGLTTPLVIILLGSSFRFDQIRGNGRYLVVAVLSKLVLIPLIFLPICVLMGFRGVELVSLIVMLASPAAVSSYTMALQMDADGPLSGQIVVFGSIASVFTMFGFIFVMKQIMLI